MNKNLSEIVFILDRSGSMEDLEKDTIGGFNSMLKKQKKEEGHANVTTILFDDKIEFLHERQEIQSVKPITDKEYFVRGCTALLDAIGYSINFMVKTQKTIADDKKANNVIFIITTDGYENASVEFTYNKIKKMINTQKEKYNWQFLFIGANIDAIETAGLFGISEEYACNYIADEKGTKLTYEVMDSAISYSRQNKNLDKSWKKNLEEDFNSRS